MIVYTTISPFLVPARKGPKESGTGEALTAKPIRTTFINHHFSPASSRRSCCGARQIPCLSAASSADRCHSLRSLIPPQAALSSLPLCTPSGASRNIYYGHNNLSPTSAVRSVRNSVSTKTDPHQCIDRGRVGVWGRAAQSRGTIVSLSPQ